MDTNKALQFLRLCRWTLAFFLAFPILMALSVPGVIHGYGHGTADAEGSLIIRRLVWMLRYKCRLGRQGWWR